MGAMGGPIGGGITAIGGGSFGGGKVIPFEVAAETGPVFDGTEVISIGQGQLLEDSDREAELEVGKLLETWLVFGRELLEGRIGVFWFGIVGSEVGAGRWFGPIWSAPAKAPIVKGRQTGIFGTKAREEDNQERCSRRFDFVVMTGSGLACPCHHQAEPRYRGAVAIVGGGLILDHGRGS